MLTKQTEVAVLGGGCFWCTEAVFKMFPGVTLVEPGYAGGATANPTYEEVSTGNTGHAEVIRIEYDPTLISFKTILTIFFASHDPSTLNRQGNDIGTQYRSVVFHTTDTQKTEAEDFIKDLNSSAEEGGLWPSQESADSPIVTEIAALEVFYPAEDYHKNYYARNSNQPYCQIIINPKLQKVQEKFAEFLKENKKL